MSGSIARRWATAVIGAAAAATAIAAGSAGAYASTAPHKHPVVVPHVPRSLISKALPSAISPTSRHPGMLRVKASQDGSVDVGDLGLWYFDSAHGYGSAYDTAHNDNWLFDNHFISSGAGQGSVVANNSEFAWNRDPHTTVIVCTGYNYTGSLNALADRIVSLLAPRPVGRLPPIPAGLLPARNGSLCVNGPRRPGEDVPGRMGRAA